MNNLKRKLLVTLLTCSTAFTLFGCGDKTADSQGANAPGTNSEAAGTKQESTKQQESVTPQEGTERQEGAAVSYPLTVTDSNGETVTIPAEPQKIVSVAPNLTELVYELGAGDLLIARSDYCDYPSEVSEVESVGTIFAPDMEKMVSLEPDLVLASTHFDGESAAKIQELSIPALTLFEENSMEGVYTMIETLGQVLNRSEQAADCVETMKTEIDGVAEKVKDAAPPTVYYAVDFGENGDFTAGGDTFAGTMIALAGGDNIAKDVSGWSITLEQIIEKDPSIILIGEAMKDDFISHPNYSGLTAVKEGRVYGIDNNLLDRQGYRNAEGVRALAEIFHPEAFE